MSDDDNIVTQDEIDNLLAEMSEESGEQKKVKEKEEEQKDPAMDPAAWGLSEDDLQAEQEAPAAPAAKTPPPPKTKDVELQQFDRQAPKVQTPRALDFVLDIPLMITVEVGRNKMTIGDLLNLGPGSIVELTKMAGEPLEIFVNNKLVARGEAVIVNEKFGVRLTDVISKTERIESLK